MQALVFQFLGNDFVLFAESGAEMGNEPIGEDDLHPITASGNGLKTLASQAWSCGAEWFFLVRADDILLLNTELKGIQCCKKTWEFLTEFVNMPELKQHRSSGKEAR